MPHRLAPIIEMIQWVFIVLVGAFSSALTWNEEDFKRVLVTVVSMILGTILSFYVKKFLNRKKSQ